jgi:hypothetical protein
MATAPAFAIEPFAKAPAKPPERTAPAFTAQKSLGKQPGTPAHHPHLFGTVLMAAVRPSFVETHISPFDSMGLRYIFKMVWQDPGENFPAPRYMGG